jgi:hypothetical protein
VTWLVNLTRLSTVKFSIDKDFGRNFHHIEECPVLLGVSLTEETWTSASRQPITDRLRDHINILDMCMVVLL